MPHEHTLTIEQEQTAWVGTGRLSLLPAEWVELGREPWGICISPDGRHVYVTQRGEGAHGEVLWFARGADGKLTLGGSIETAGKRPNGIVISPDGKHVYALDEEGAEAINRYERNESTGALTALGTAAAGEVPRDIAISPSGLLVYVANAGAKTLGEYTRNPANGVLTFVRNITVASIPEVVRFSPDGQNMYVVGGGKIYVYAAEGSLLGTTSPEGEGSRFISFSPDARHAYVSQRIFLSGNNRARISVYKRKPEGTLEPLENLLVGDTTHNTPNDIVVTRDGANMYVSAQATPAGEVYELARNPESGALTGFVPAKVAAFSTPWRMVASPDDRNVYVVNRFGVPPRIAEYKRDVGQLHSHNLLISASQNVTLSSGAAETFTIGQPQVATVVGIGPGGPHTHTLEITQPQHAVAYHLGKDVGLLPMVV